MRFHLAALLLLTTCDMLSQKEVLCSQTTRCDVSANPDLAVSLSPASVGCLSGVGADVTAVGQPSALACATVFSNVSGQKADMQCKAPYHLCNEAKTIDLAKCNMISSGFFIANVPAHQGPGANLSCGTTMKATDMMWGGCGRPATNVACQGFTMAQLCDQNSFQCADTSLAGLSNTDPASGVLCCHP